MNLAFNNHHPPIGKWVKIQKSAQRMIFKFFALELYISWEAETQEKLQVLLKQTLRLDRLAVVTQHGILKTLNVRRHNMARHVRI